MTLEEYKCILKDIEYHTDNKYMNLLTLYMNSYTKCNLRNLWLILQSNQSKE